MLGDLARRLGAGLVAAVMMAVAAGIALVATSFALYALFCLFASPAVASALTAGIFAAITALIAYFAPKLINPGAETHRRAQRPDAATMRLFAELGLAALGVVADLGLQKRWKGRQTRRDVKRSRREHN